MTSPPSPPNRRKQELPPDPVGLLEACRSRNDSQKCRLFAVACCRRIWEHLGEELLAAVVVAENFAHGLVDDNARVSAGSAVRQQCEYADSDSSAADRFQAFKAEAVLCTLFGDHDYPPIPTYATTCAIACSRAVIEVISANAELSGECEQSICARVAFEREWQREYLRREFGLSPASAADQAVPE
ncbi:hypothetical protein AYO47_07605 [Planctomyces sp. SCGC AG-212-M04]|nr:hypothetical protein AYO47_07605 [Planctomyces sp. SCGC AG-212-M04]